MAQIKGSITVFPARAGVIPAFVTMLIMILSLSRTSGGDPHRKIKNRADDRSFPHERG